LRIRIVFSDKYAPAYSSGGMARSVGSNFVQYYFSGFSNGQLLAMFHTTRYIEFGDRFYFRTGSGPWRIAGGGQRLRIQSLF
jgi:hypothetical protein